MFNFVEKKSFFYFSAIVSVLLSFCMFFSFAANFRTSVVNILVIIMLLAMMILYNYEHKEIMKVLLTSFFTILMINRVEFLFQTFSVINDRLVAVGLQYDSIKHTIIIVKAIITGIIVPILFINHFILNYNGKNSKIVININKFLLVIMALYTIVEVISNFIVSSKSGISTHIVTYRMIGTSCYLLFCCMTIVSVEAFINSRRAEKETASTSKVSKSSNAKKKINKKTTKKSKKK